MKLRLMLGGLALAVAFAGPALAADKIKIGFITKFPVPYFATMEDAAKAYAKAHPDVEIVYGQGTSATDIEGQIALIEKMVTQGVQGIAITPVDPTVATTLDKAVAAGVKVVLMDNNIPDWKNQTALATTNNLEAGKIAGEYLKTVLKDGDKLGILEGVPGVPSLDDRVNGMLEGLKGVNVEIVGKGATDCTEEKGINVAQDILTANPAAQGDLFGLRPARSRCRPGDQERQARPPHHPGRLRLLLRRAGSARGWRRGRVGGAVPGQDVRARRRCTGQGDQRRKGRVADRLGRRPGHQGEHRQVPSKDPRGPDTRRPPFSSCPDRVSAGVTCSLWMLLFALNRVSSRSIEGRRQDRRPAARWCGRGGSVSAARTITYTRASIPSSITRA